MPEKLINLEGMIKSEEDPHTKRLLRAMQKWYKPPHGFEVPGRNYLGIQGGFYDRNELFPIMIGGYKPGIAPKIRERLVQTSRTIFEAMCLCDDGDPTFEPQWVTTLDRIDS